MVLVIRKKLAVQCIIYIKRGKGNQGRENGGSQTALSISKTRGKIKRRKISASKPSMHANEG